MINCKEILVKVNELKENKELHNIAWDKIKNKFYVEQSKIYTKDLCLKEFFSPKHKTEMII